jgi:hypothetical protein
LGAGDSHKLAPFSNYRFGWWIFSTGGDASRCFAGLFSVRRDLFADFHVGLEDNKTRGLWLKEHVDLWQPTRWQHTVQAAGIQNLNLTTTFNQAKNCF